jgi:hypothetical protein
MAVMYFALPVDLQVLALPYELGDGGSPGRVGAGVCAHKELLKTQHKSSPVIVCHLSVFDMHQVVRHSIRAVCSLQLHQSSIGVASTCNRSCIGSSQSVADTPALGLMSCSWLKGLSNDHAFVCCCLHVSRRAA